MTNPVIRMPLTQAGQPFNITPAESECIARCAHFLLEVGAFGDQPAPTPTPGGTMVNDAQIALGQAQGMQRAGEGFVALTRTGLQSMAIVVWTCEFTLENSPPDDLELISRAAGLNLPELSVLAAKFRELGGVTSGEQQSGLKA